MEEILKINNIEEKWNSDEVENLILEKLNSKF
jgi:hypothetical protein